MRKFKVGPWLTLGIVVAILSCTRPITPKSVANDVVFALDAGQRACVLTEALLGNVVPEKVAFACGAEKVLDLIVKELAVFASAEKAVAAVRMAEAQKTDAAKKP